MTAGQRGLPRSLGLWIPVTVLLGAVVLGTALTAGAWQEQSFPHERHERLFPLCTGCHEGVPSGNVAAFYPPTGLCANCHDGQDLDRVTWSGPSPRVDNVEFSHDAHATFLSSAGDPEPTCESCHVAPGSRRMAVAAEIQVGTCLSCHAHQADDHQVDADCSVCHVPLAETRFSLARIEGLAVPADHQAADFLEAGHGAGARADQARCATCHTADRCVSCHVDVDRRPIRAMPFAPEGMELPAAVAHYPEPATHQDAGWFTQHGLQATRQACATCHTSDDCAACHIAPAPTQVAALPARAEVSAPGVHVLPQAPESHEGFFFMQIHSVLAAGDQKSCNTCHVESFCSDCHQGPADGGYHPPGFVARHAADAFGRQSECANCHEVQVFCRNCHVQVGLSSVGRLGPGYHEGGSVWLLRHGMAARQNLEGCTSCHRQNDCTQCHGVLGAFKVSPHSRNFDARRAWEQNPRTCFACHIKNPLEGRSP